MIPTLYLISDGVTPCGLKPFDPKMNVRTVRMQAIWPTAERNVIGPLLPAKNVWVALALRTQGEVMNAIFKMRVASASGVCLTGISRRAAQSSGTSTRREGTGVCTGSMHRINHQHLIQVGAKAGLNARPSANMIDSQSVKTTESGDPLGYYTGKKFIGRKRQNSIGTGGLLVGAMFHGAHIQDRDRAAPLLASICTAFHWLQQVFADGGNVGSKLKEALAKRDHSTLIVKHSDTNTGFSFLPRRWVVERSSAWFCYNRRLAKVFDCECRSMAIDCGNRKSLKPFRHPLQHLAIALSALPAHDVA